MMKRLAYWTHDDRAALVVGHLYYFAPTSRAPGPYKTQRRVTAIIDIADDGTLAGVELIDNMPPPPRSAEQFGHATPEEEHAAMSAADSSPIGFGPIELPADCERGDE